ncbi:hypothetical protein [Streptomyces sp. NPDC019539]|uniref:hypothetical protein n=1 Tax=Streptomyces sp. NPDC019539 TaxID=3365063 RepID=UPI00378A9F96
MDFKSAVIAVVITVTGVQAAGVPPASAVHSPHLSTVENRATNQITLQELLDRVSVVVHNSFPKAELLVASGESPSGPTRDMSHVTDWRFIYSTGADLGIKTVEVRATLSGQISRPINYKASWRGALPFRGSISLTPTDAYNILQEMGHREAYKYVALVTPLVGEQRRQYHFNRQIEGGCDGYAVGIDDHIAGPICDGGPLF